jgi:hypothetical protein
MPAAVTQEINSMAATIAASIRATPSNLATIDALLAAINGSVASAAANEFVSGSANFASLNAALKAAVVNLFSSDMANLMQQQGIAPNSAAANDIETAALGSSAVANGPSTSAVDALSSFGISYSNSVPIATVKVFQGYANIFEDSPNLSSRLGIQVTAATSVGSPTLADYMSSELLSHDGGIINFYLLIAGPDTVKYVDAQNTWIDRKYAIDKDYSFFGLNHLADPGTLHPLDADGNREKLNEEILAYDEHSLFYLPVVGVKAIKTSLESPASTSTTAGTTTGTASTSTSMAAAGVAYYGLGFDGPLFQEGGDPNNSGGGIGFEAHVSSIFANKNTLDSIFQTKNASTHTYEWGVLAKAYYHQVFSINLGYDVPVGANAKSFMHAVTTVSIGYNR